VTLMKIIGIINELSVFLPWPWINIDPDVN
jgi:hypothetical protein